MVTFFLLFFFLRDKWRILSTVEGLMPLAPPKPPKSCTSSAT